MSSEQKALLHPQRPPLIEVALTIQFEPLPELKSAYIGALWDRVFRADFPRVSEQTPIGQVLELESPVFRSAEPLVKFVAEPVVPRFFFRNEDETKLVQVQNDRLSFNWRRHEEEYRYPRYATVRTEFVECFTKLVDFIEREKLGEVTPNQCEVLYVNHVLYAPGPATHSSLGALIKPWSATYTSLAGAQLDDVVIRARHVIKDGRGSFIGRLHVNIDPAYLASDRTPIYKIEFVARGRPLGEGVDGGLRFLDLGHERLLQGFTEFISDEVQRDWRVGLV